MSKISTETRRELVATIQERYRSASPLDKQRILDEFVALTGYHRKHAIRVLGSGSTPRLLRPRRVSGSTVKLLRRPSGCSGKRLTASAESGSSHCCRR